MNNNTFSVLSKTYPFLLVRFIVSIAVFVPVYYSILWGINLGRSISGMDFILLDICWAYVGFVIFVFYIRFIQSVLMHYVSYAHVSAMTSVIQGEEIEGGLVSHSIRQTISRFGSVSAMYVADRFIQVMVKEVTSFLLEKGDIIPTRFKKGVLARFAGATIQVIVYNLCEIIMSYLFANPDKGMWKGVVEAVAMFAKAWKQILKSAFMNTLSIKIFSFVVKIALVVWFVWEFKGLNLLNLIVGYIFLKLLLTVMKSTFLEPYQTCMMLIGFHKYRLSSKSSNDDPSVDISHYEEHFRNMVSRGKEEQQDISKEFAETLASGLNLGESKLFSGLNSLLSTVKKQTKEIPSEGNESL